MGQLAGLHPAYFAMVMATGIVSIAAQLLQMRWIALALLWLNLACYVVLWGATLLRTLRFRANVVADISDPKRGVGYFTVVAATNVLGSQFVVVHLRPMLALPLLVVGALLWLLVNYTVLTAISVQTEKREPAEAIHGGWLLAVVAPQSIAVLACLLSPHVTGGQQPLLFVALVMWSGGGMLYIWIISIIFYRYTFLSFQPSDLTPPYWINMGAVAISTLAGALLVSNSGSSALLTELRPFLKGMTLMFWATATWWIPMLVILGVWRHVVCRFPLKYDPLYWGAVFPLGMYTVATFRLSEAIGSPALMWIPDMFIYPALAAWVMTFAGLLISLLRPDRRGS